MKSKEREKNEMPAINPKVSALGKVPYKSYAKPRELMKIDHPREINNVFGSREGRVAQPPRSKASSIDTTSFRDLLKQNSPRTLNTIQYVNKETER